MTSKGEASSSSSSSSIIPSALENFNEIIAASEGKQIAMFLDYDGTLSPIVEDPFQAFMSEETRETLGRLSGCFPTAIVSGRGREKVYNFVKVDGLCYAGSHGMDILYTEGDKGLIYQPDDAADFPRLIDEVFGVLSERTKSIDGVLLENNAFCMSVHYRCVDEQKWDTLKDQVELVLKNYPTLHLKHGKMVYEVRPAIKWDKGDAVKFLLKSLGYANKEDLCPIYIGDDRTDEDAFEVLKERGLGFGILVAKESRETSASYQLQEPEEVRTFMQRLVDWKNPKTKVTE